MVGIDLFSKLPAVSGPRITHLWIQTFHHILGEINGKDKSIDHVRQARRTKAANNQKNSKLGRLRAKILIFGYRIKNPIQYFSVSKNAVVVVDSYFSINSIQLITLKLYPAWIIISRELNPKLLFHTKWRWFFEEIVFQFQTIKFGTFTIFEESFQCLFVVQQCWSFAHLAAWEIKSIHFMCFFPQ